MCERFPGCLCCQEESVFLVTLSNTEFTARELCQRCDVLASKKAQDALFFFPFCISSHSISLTLLTAACVVYMYTKKKIKCSQPHPSVFLLCIHGNKKFSLLSFRVISKMSTKTRSQLCLKTSKYALPVHLSCLALAAVCLV